MVDSIIFDLDGTLWDGTDGAAVIWNEVAKQYPQVKEVITADKLKSVYGLPLREIATKLYTSIEKDLALKIMEESVVKQCPYLAKHGGILYEGLEETLKELNKSYRLFIVSNCEEGYIQCFYEAHGFGDYFEDFEYPGRSNKLKADNIKDIISRNGLLNPVYVGDTRGDEKASKEANIPFIFATYGFGQVENPKWSINSLKELPNHPLLVK